MTAPHDFHPEALEEDPTGMRALLSSLPDPGPMPDDLVDRITASLAAEQAGPALDELAERRRRRLPRRPVLVAAAAAAVVVAGGSPDSAPGCRAPSSPRSRPPDRPPRTSPPPAGTSPGPSPRHRDQPTAAAGPGTEGVVVLHTGTAYAAAGLAGEASALRDSPAVGAARAKGAAAADDGSSGVSSLAGARACATAIGVPETSAVVVDVATVDDAPAAVVLAEAPDGTSTAYAVGLRCGRDAPDLLAGPVTVP